MTSLEEEDEDEEEEEEAKNNGCDLRPQGAVTPFKNLYMQPFFFEVYIYSHTTVPYLFFASASVQPGRENQLNG